MTRSIGIIAGALICLCCCIAYAEYGVIDKGTWPKSGPAQLEPTRKGPMAPNLHYAIHFNNRKEFEAAWRHILKVKTKGAPVFIKSAPNFFLSDYNAGVVIHCPPEGQDPATSEAPIAGVADPRERWMNATSIDLLVDGDI